jgi:post-segregation antitoxin (ccd killing protein)
MMTPDELRGAIQRSKMPIGRIADAAGIAKTTLYSFVSGDSESLRAPAHAAVEAVMGARGKVGQISEEPTALNMPSSVPVPVPGGLLATAREYDLDVETLLAKGGLPALQAEARREFRERNRDVVEANRAHIEKYGTFGQRHGLFRTR